VITCFDPEYKRAKLIKQGKDYIPAPYDQLARWITQRWGIKILDVAHEIIRPTNRPRLQIVVEQESEKLFFTLTPFGQTLPPVEREVVEQLRSLLEANPPPQLDSDGIFVIFSAFAPIAMEEANGRIPQEEISALRTKLANPEVWEIRKNFRSATFLFLTDLQAELAATRGLKEIYTDRYFELIKNHDEFGYLKREKFRVHFDSKENFDTKYGSSWFHYDRDN
jgi:hypothetical protein